MGSPIYFKVLKKSVFSEALPYSERGQKRRDRILPTGQNRHQKPFRSGLAKFHWGIVYHFVKTQFFESAWICMTCIACAQSFDSSFKRWILPKKLFNSKFSLKYSLNKFKIQNIVIKSFQNFIHEIGNYSKYKLYDIILKLWVKYGR